MESSALSFLRAATREAHEQLERRLDIFSRIGSLEGRRTLVERFHGLHAGADEVLRPVLKDVPDLDYEMRRRGELLDADLAALGAASPPVCPMDPPRSTPEAMGRLYVLEGSTLGGKMISRQAMSLGLGMTGLGFMDPYGAGTGQAWRGFLAVLAREGAGAEEEVVKGGVAGFAYTESWLCAPEPVS